MPIYRSTSDDGVLLAHSWSMWCPFHRWLDPAIMHSRRTAASERRPLCLALPRTSARLPCWIAVILKISPSKVYQQPRLAHTTLNIASFTPFARPPCHLYFYLPSLALFFARPCGLTMLTLTTYRGSLPDAASCLDQARCHPVDTSSRLALA